MYYQDPSPKSPEFYLISLYQPNTFFLCLNFFMLAIKNRRIPQQYYFAHEIRKKLGLRNYETVNIENLTAADLNLGMFSASELMVGG